MSKIHTLDTNGNVAGTKAVMKRLFQNFLLSDYSQTMFYTGHVASLRYIYSKHADDADKLENEIKGTLEVLYGRYFEIIEVDVVAQVDKENKIHITIAIKVTDKKGRIEYLENSVNQERLLELYSSRT